MKRYTGNLVIVLSVVLTVVVWIVFAPENDGSDPTFARRYAGEILGSIVIVLLSFSLFLSARPKWAEPYFGGLDKMYVTHRQTSTSALLLLFVHLLTVPISINDMRIGNYLAIVAFLGIVSIALVTLAPRIPFLNKLTGGTYDGWKKLHRFIGIFFILGFIHSLTVKALDALVAITWVQLFFIFGTVSYLYTEIFGRFFRKYLPYTVEAVKHPNAATTEVTMRAKKRPIKKQRAGQFLFVRFPGDRILNESHPFTISSSPQEDVLRVTVKASGDFTRYLLQHLQPGMDAVVEGAYGRFDYKTGGPRQVWVAGGIGLTPFLSFIRDMDGSLSHDVDFYYTVRHPEEALFVEEIQAAAQRIPRLKPHIRFSATEGSLTVEEIVRNFQGSLSDMHVYLCGPLPMILAFERNFLKLGLPKKNIHYEEFNFR
jgi:predicted ferric reductase